MNTYRLSKPAAHELASHLLGIAAARLNGLSRIAKDSDYRGDGFGPEALHLFTEVSVINLLSGIIDDIGAAGAAGAPLTIEDRESDACDGWSAEFLPNGFAISFDDHCGIGDAVRVIANRDAARRARTLAELRDQASDIARRIAELEACQ